MGRQRARTEFRHLQGRGYSAEEAANLIALRLGADRVATGWTLHELLTMLWLREQRADGRFGSRDGTMDACRQGGRV